MDKRIEKLAIQKLSNILYEAGLKAYQVPKGNSAHEWTAYRLKIAKQVHDKLTADE